MSTGLPKSRSNSSLYAFPPFQLRFSGCARTISFEECCYIMHIIESYELVIGLCRWSYIRNRLLSTPHETQWFFNSATFFFWVPNIRHVPVTRTKEHRGGEQRNCASPLLSYFCVLNGCLSARARIRAHRPAATVATAERPQEVARVRSKSKITMNNITATTM